MKRYLYLCISLLVFASKIVAYEDLFDGKEIPSRIIPIPNTVSLGIQRVIAAPSEGRERMMSFVPQSNDDWEKLVSENYKQGCEKVKAIRKFFPMREIEKASVGGVNAYLITPESFKYEYLDRLLIHVHGGSFIFSGGESCLPEAILVAHYAQCRVLSIDYRMPPKHPFPAAIDDLLSVYREALKKFKASKIAFFGSSSGANIITASLLNFRSYNLPLPAVVSLSNPIADLTNTGDTRFTNEYVDNNLISYNGLLKAAFLLYSGGFDLKDVMLSPVYGDFTKGFSAAIITSGTRDLMLSDAVRLYSKLRQANIDAKLQVVEGLSHGQHLTVSNTPESQLALKEIADFLNNYLSKTN